MDHNDPSQTSDVLSLPDPRLVCVTKSFGFTKTSHASLNANIDPTKVQLPNGYTVLIIGATRGIGEYIAYAYAEAKATNVIITGRTTSDLDRVKKNLEDMAQKQISSIKVWAFHGDALRYSDYDELLQVLNNQFDSRLDCLVFNAGGGNGKSVWDQHVHNISIDEYVATTELNYLGPFYAVHKLFPLMLKPQNRGKLFINITSGASLMTHLSPTPYNISKMAANRLVQSIGESYVDEGLTAIALHPGLVASPGGLEMPFEYMREMLTDDLKLCGAVCVWFSKEKRPWASGRYISSKWDMDELESQKDDIVKFDKLKFKMEF